MNQDEKQKYNAGYRAGYRAATIQHLGGRCMYFYSDSMRCEETSVKQLEIHHLNGEGLHKKPCKDHNTGRGPEDWTDLANLRVYCKEHHQLIDDEEKITG